MSVKRKILVVFGTRPEAIKLCPLIKEFEKHEDIFETRVCVTAQHREMLEQALKLFEIYPQYDLDIMTANQTLSYLTSKALPEIIAAMEKEKPDVIFVQGDTTTTFVSSLAAYYLKIPVAHIEAGLRTKDKFSPFPEEINRRLTSVLADYHFTPTKDAENNLSKGFKRKIEKYVPDATMIFSPQWVPDGLNFEEEFGSNMKSLLANEYDRNKIIEQMTEEIFSLPVSA